MSSDKTRVSAVRSLEEDPEFEEFTRVVVQSEDVRYDTTGLYPQRHGRTLVVETPWPLPGHSYNLLNRIRGLRYQPYSAKGAILDPAVELGDGVTIGDLYGGVYRQKITFGKDYNVDISAPGEEEIDHEFPYTEKQNRKVSRKLAEFSSELKIQSDLISAKVSRTGGDESSFGWELDDSSWVIKANGLDVLKATQDGLEVYGKITATGGTIGGFKIESEALSTNNQTFGGTNTRGIYIGPSGIQLGPNFQVDAYGNLKAASGEFTGRVSAGNISYGGGYGYFSGSGISNNSIYGNRLAYNTISTAYTSSGINTSLGYAEDFNLVNIGAMDMYNLGLKNLFYYQNYKISRNTQYVQTAAGGKTIYYLGWA